MPGTSFRAVMACNARRMLTHRVYIALSCALICAAVACAVFFNDRAQTVGSVALVAPEAGADFASDRLSVTRLDREPPRSALVEGRYDAVIVADAGGYRVDTIRGDDFKRSVAAALRDPSASARAASGATRRAGANIIGFLTMFVLMQGFTMMGLFCEDCKDGQIRRIASSPVSFGGYLCAHGLFSYAFIVVPTMAALALARFAFGADIGLGLADHFLLISLLSLLSTSFALLIYACMPAGDEASMTGTIIVVLSSLLAGSFYAFERGNRILEALIAVLPQKTLLTLADHVERTGGWAGTAWQVAYLAALAAAASATAVALTRARYVRA